MGEAEEKRSQDRPGTVQNERSDRSRYRPRFCTRSALWTAVFSAALWARCTHTRVCQADNRVCAERVSSTEGAFDSLDNSRRAPGAVMLRLVADDSLPDQQSVLVVEDNPGDVRLIREALRGLNP